MGEGEGAVDAYGTRIVRAGGVPTSLPVSLFTTQERLDRRKGPRAQRSRRKGTRRSRMPKGAENAVGHRVSESINPVPPFAPVDLSEDSPRARVEERGRQPHGVRTR